MSSKAAIVAIVVVVSAVASSFALVNYLSVEQGCTDVLSKTAETEKPKMIMQNRDGGLFLLMQELTGSISFVGYVGPKTATQLEADMSSVGLLNVVVKTSGTCVADSGLEYTVVEGQYTPRAAAEPEREPM